MGLIGIVIAVIALLLTMCRAGRRRYDVATFAGGCFWCMEPPFAKLQGVVEVIVGYTGGAEPQPTYKEVSTGRTGHMEAVRVTFDPAIVGYAQLLDVFWRQIDPTQGDGQFADIGPQYRSAIFWHDEKQRRLAERSRELVAHSGIFDGPIATEILPAGEFWPAEPLHQNYWRKRPMRYKLYRSGSGRDRFLQSIWGGGHEHLDLGNQ
jgi:methionine-S-sulfoxide reductase